MVTASSVADDDPPMTLPEPDPAFHWTAEAWGHALRCRPLLAIAQHAFTTKQLQLRLAAAGPDERYVHAWQQAAAAVGARLEQVIRVKQVHSSVVHVIDRAHAATTDAAARPEADAIVSNGSNLVLTVQVADCVPILLADAGDRSQWPRCMPAGAEPAPALLARRFTR